MVPSHLFPEVPYCCLNINFWLFQGYFATYYYIFYLDNDFRHRTCDCLVIVIKLLNGSESYAWRSFSVIKVQFGLVMMGNRIRNHFEQFLLQINCFGGQFEKNWPRLFKNYRNLQNIEISHLVHKLWVCKVQKRLNSSFLEIYFLGMVTSENCAQLSILISEIDTKNFRIIS